MTSKIPPFLERIANAFTTNWIPAFVGMFMHLRRTLDHEKPRFVMPGTAAGRDPESSPRPWIPACAGMTNLPFFGGMTLLLGPSFVMPAEAGIQVPQAGAAS